MAPMPRVSLGGNHERVVTLCPLPKLLDLVEARIELVERGLEFLVLLFQRLDGGERHAAGVPARVRPKLFCHFS